MRVRIPLVAIFLALSSEIDHQVETSDFLNEATSQSTLKLVFFFKLKFLMTNPIYSLEVITKDVSVKHTGTGEGIYCSFNGLDS